MCFSLSVRFVVIRVIKLFYVTLVIIIKIINYFFLLLYLFLPNHLKLSSMMCALLLLSLMMVLNITLSLLITLPNISGFIHLSIRCSWCLYKFKATVKKNINWKIITIYFDNGGEYHCLTKLLAIHGISHLTTPHHTIEHNGYFEDIVVILSKLISLYFLMPLFL